jgi:hypothetical protein
LKYYRHRPREEPEIKATDVRQYYMGRDDSRGIHYLGAVVTWKGLSQANIRSWQLQKLTLILHKMHRYNGSSMERMDHLPVLKSR